MQSLNMLTTNKFMQEAIFLAKDAELKGEIPVAALIVNLESGKIISKAHNLTELNKNPLHHAEILAISDACKVMNQKILDNCDIYVTLEPCPMCAQAISFARIRRLYFGAYDIKSGGVDNGPRIFDSSSAHHKPEVYSGILESDCANILTEFFKKMRQ